MGACLFGMVNQVAWEYSLSPIMLPFQDLIKPNTKFYWDYTLDDLFNSSKEIIIDLVKQGVQTFNLSQQTCIQPLGVEKALVIFFYRNTANAQKSPVSCQDGWKLIFAGSRFTKKAEKNYSPTEGEALALSWSLKHSHLFTLGVQTLLLLLVINPFLAILPTKSWEAWQTHEYLDLKKRTSMAHWYLIVPWQMDS